MCFPAVANAVMGSVPLRKAGVASGTNSMLRGVLGIAVLVSVFARQGVYKSPHVLIDGFTQALWVGVGFSALGAVAALLAPGRQRPAEATAGDRPLPRGPLGSWVDSVASRVLNPRGAPRRVSCAIRSIRRSPQSRSSP